MRARACLLSMAAVLAAGCSSPEPSESTAVVEQNASTVDGNAFLTKLVAELAADPTSSVRSAIDRAVNAQKGLSVEPHPGSCSSVPERLYWNGEDRAFARLGVVGVADLLVLEARTQGPIDASKLARAPIRTRQELAKALAILARAESPVLLAEAVAMLTQNADVKGAELRSLLLFSLDIEETKRFRDANGTMRVPDLEQAPSEATLFDRLRSSPNRGMRAAAASQAARAGIAISAARADAIVADPSYRVRAEAGAVFWRGTVRTPARQRAVLATFTSPDALAQMRADTLLEDYGIREEEAGAWSNLPAGIQRRVVESKGSFIGRALEAAPADADVTALVEAAAGTTQLTDIVESAVDAIARSTAMDRAAKIKILGSLRNAAADAAWHNRTTPLVRLASAITTFLVEAPLSQLTSTELVAQLDESYGYALPDTWAAVRTALDSPDPALRLGALETMALAKNATESTGIQLVLLRRPSLAPATRKAILDAVEAALFGADIHAVFGAARATGTDPRDVLARIHRMLAALTAQNYRPWGSFARAYVEAAADPALSADEMVAAVVDFTTKLDPISLLDPGTPGAGPMGPTVRTETFALVQLLEQPRVSSAKRKATWKTLLVRPDGLRGSLLEAMPTSDEGRSAIASIVSPFLVQQVATCWRGQMENSAPRPAIMLYLVPYVIAPPTAAVDAAAVTKGRIATVRAQSATLAPLPAGTTRATLFAAAPKWKDSDLASDMFEAPERAKYEATAADAATALLASPATTSVSDLAAAVHRLGLARGVRDLPLAKLAEVETFIQQKIVPEAAAAQYLFFLRVQRGDGYDALAAKFRTRVGFRWDLGDAARPRGEPAALEAILGAVGTGFGTLGSVLSLASQVVGGAAVTPSFRQGLLEYGADSERFWGSRGQWATGLLPMTRAMDADLSFIARGDMNRPIVTMSPSGDSRVLRESSLYGEAAGDPRMPPAAALTLAWNRLSHGKIAMLFDGAPKLHVTLLVDTVLRVMARPDISPDEKAALGKALRYELD